MSTAPRLTLYVKSAEQEAEHGVCRACLAMQRRIGRLGLSEHVDILTLDSEEGLSIVEEARAQGLMGAPLLLVQEDGHPDEIFYGFRPDVLSSLAPQVLDDEE